MNRLLILLLFSVLSAFAQETNTARRIQQTSSLPAEPCADGAVRFKTSATKGTYQCIDGAWSLISGGTPGPQGPAGPTGAQGNPGDPAGVVYGPIAVTAQTSVTVTAATHGAGTTPVAFCFDASNVRVDCAWSTNVSGDVTFSWNPAFTGYYQINGPGTNGSNVLYPIGTTAAAVQAAVDALTSGGTVVLRARTTYAFAAGVVQIDPGQNNVRLFFEEGAKITYSGNDCPIKVGSAAAVTSHFKAVFPNIQLLSGSGSASCGIWLIRTSHTTIFEPIITTETLGGAYTATGRSGIYSDGGDNASKFSAYTQIINPYIAGDFQYGIYQTHGTGQIDGNNRNQVLGGVLATTVTGHKKQDGTVSVTNGNATITGTGFTAAMDGFKFVVVRPLSEQLGTPRPRVYTATFVNSTTMTLDAVYAGATNATASYRLYDASGPIGIYMPYGDTTRIAATDFDSWSKALVIGGHANEYIGSAFEGNNGSDWEVLSGANGTGIFGAFADNWIDAGTLTRYQAGSNGGSNVSRLNNLTATGTVRVTGDDAGSTGACINFGATPYAANDAILCRAGGGTLLFGNGTYPTLSYFQNNFGAAALASYFAGDATGRWYVTGGGAMGWSDGTTADAMLLSRSATNTLQLANGTLVEGNGANVASAATTALTAGNLFHITGTTTITTLNTCNAANAGRRVTLIFDGALTVTDGNNLKLNGNFVTTADDTLTLSCDGTNWYEVARSAN